LQDPLAEEILAGGYAPGSTVAVDVVDGAFVLQKRTSPSA
jgi:ATP-dependent Clp protease ATP-binding subunit ClpB